MEVVVVVLSIFIYIFIFNRSSIFNFHKNIISVWVLVHKITEKTVENHIKTVI